MPAFMWLPCLEAGYQTNLKFLERGFFWTPSNLVFPGHHRGGRGDQGDAEDDGLPVHPRPPDDHRR